MHPISDKELDKLVQQSFDDLQVEPSNEVWEKISNSLDKKKQVKKTFSILWMAAASVVLVFSVGLWFTGTSEKLIDQDSPVIVQEEKELIDQDAVSESFNTSSKEKSVQVLLSKSLKNKVANDLSKAEPTLVNEVVKVIPEMQAPKEPSDEIIASNVIKRPIIIQPKQEVRVPERYTRDQSTLDLSRPDLTASQDTKSVFTQYNDDAIDRGKRVKGIGGLVNFVIAQVDKREDKLIEFTESDEGTEISGINLGLLKIKSKK
jgi:hypothetical protein